MPESDFERYGEASSLFRRTPECPPIEQLDGSAPAADSTRAHVEHCAFCQNEIALLQAFEAGGARRVVVARGARGNVVSCAAAGSRRHGDLVGGHDRGADRIALASPRATPAGTVFPMAGFGEGRGGAGRGVEFTRFSHSVNLG